MITPKSRKEFERNLYILKESLGKRQTKLAPHSRMIKGLIESRLTPNRRMNFRTVDETLRLNANMSFNMPMMMRNKEKT